MGTYSECLLERPLCRLNVRLVRREDYSSMRIVLNRAAKLLSYVDGFARVVVRVLISLANE